MIVRAGLGELRISHELFSAHFDAWLANHHQASKGTRADYRRQGERRLKPFFGSMRLSTIHVQTVRSSVSEMARLVDDDEIAAKTVNNALGRVSTAANV
jgi:Phage integrase, N-terminal SAM-like domain